MEGKLELIVKKWKWFSDSGTSNYSKTVKNVFDPAPNKFCWPENTLKLLSDYLWWENYHKLASLTLILTVSLENSGTFLQAK